MADKGIAGARLAKLGRYEVLSELGKGAMGVVYLAKDPVIGRMVAIKTIRTANIGDDDAESREFRERFIREAQTAGILSHPNIVTIHDIGEDSDTQTSFIAMEYIEGKNLKSLLSEKAHFSYDQVADMIAQVAEAIDYAHRKGIIHRDIKPANIIITTDEKVKITDFGIAKVASSNLTTTGQFLGTPNYMSPEQVSGAPVDGRSDIFSLGVVLYELLTKRKPFQGENLTAISYKIVHEDFTPPAELSRDVPPEFNPIVARAMAKDPWNRYQRGKDFALALHQLRAHLEEQKALQDLGTIVSEAEFMPTLRLTNLDQLVAEAAEAEGRSTQVTPPEDRATEVLSADAMSVDEPLTATATHKELADTNPSLSANTPPPSPAYPEELRTKVISRQEFAPVLSAPPPAPPPPPVAAAALPPPPPPLRPSMASKPAVVPAAGPMNSLKRLMAELAAKDWSKFLKAEINTRWFVGVAACVLGFWILALAPLLVYAILAGRPSQPWDAALEKETKEKQHSLAEAQKLFAAGQYDRSLALCRVVLARSPHNRLARQFAQMSENALAGRQQQADKTAAADKAMQAAQAAFGAGNYEEARRGADEVLSLDGGRVEAQQLRSDAASKIAEAEAAAAAKKKAAKAPASVARRAPTPATVTVAQRSQTVAPTAPAAVASGPTTLRVLFASPISEGNLMVAVNDKIVLRQPFDFRKGGLFKKGGTGTVDVGLPIQPGAISIKAWLSGPDIPASLLAQASAQLSAGESKTLRLDYSSGRLSAHVQ